MWESQTGEGSGIFKEALQTKSGDAYQVDITTKWALSIRDERVIM